MQGIIICAGNYNLCRDLSSTRRGAVPGRRRRIGRGGTAVKWGVDLGWEVWDGGDRFPLESQHGSCWLTLAGGNVCQPRDGVSSHFCN